MARILVIDDDLDLLQMMQLMLQRGGHEAIVTGDGADGIAKAQQLHPEVAIVDLMMPGMNGFQVVHKLRENPATADISIMILTARAQPVDRDAAMAAKADTYMAKPVSPSELLLAVKELLVKHSQATLPPNLVLTVFSLRGGVGTTTVAVNLALALQQASRPVCLVDLCMKSGHVAAQMRLKAQVTWAELLPQVGNLSLDGLKQVLLRHDSGVWVLPSPFLPTPPPPGEAIVRLLGLLKPGFGATIADLGAFGDVGRAALAVSDLILTVLSPEVASLQTSAATLRTLKALNVPDHKIMLVANNVAPRFSLSTAAIEKALGRTLCANLPYDEAQAQALSQGSPLMVSQPDSPLADGVRQLIQAMSPARAY
jgi:DNA-binding response OmpR family regulator